MSHGKRCAWPSMGRLGNIRFTFTNNMIIEQYVCQERHGGLGQPGGLGQVRPAERGRRPQNGVDDDREVVVPQIILIDGAQGSHGSITFHEGTQALRILGLLQHLTFQPDGR